MSGRKELTAERLRELLRYDPETGFFTWIVSRQGIRDDGVAGCASGSRYQWLGIDGCVYKVHRLAWLWMTGKWPAHHIDHINMDKTDNRFCNLRGRRSHKIEQTRAAAPITGPGSRV